MLPERLPPDKTFKTFATNLLGDIELINQLRELSKEAMSPGQQQEVDEVLTKVVAMSAETYETIRAYAGERTCLGPEISQDPADKIIADLKTRIEFEEAWGPCLRELGEPIAALKNCVDLLPSLSHENRQVCLSRIDQALGLISATMTAYKYHFQSEPDVYRHIEPH
ncbi:MAG TPA: hypothetical protein VGD99_23250 [Anaerolineae bacterium]|jgi:hypothetical protein